MGPVALPKSSLPGLKPVRIKPKHVGRLNGETNLLCNHLAMAKVYQLSQLQTEHLRPTGYESCRAWFCWSKKMATFIRPQRIVYGLLEIRWAPFVFGRVTPQGLRGNDGAS